MVAAAACYFLLCKIVLVLQRQSFNVNGKKMHRKLLNAINQSFLNMCSVKLTLDAKREMSNLTRACVLACFVWGEDATELAGRGAGLQPCVPAVRGARGRGGDAAGPSLDSCLSTSSQTAPWTCSLSWTPQRVLP